MIKIIKNSIDFNTKKLKDLEKFADNYQAEILLCKSELKIENPKLTKLIITSIIETIKKPFFIYYKNIICINLYV